MTTVRLLAPLAALLALAACNAEQKAEAPKDEHTGAQAAKSGPQITAGRLVLPAVANNPSAAYFNLENKGKGTLGLTGVAIANAQKAEMHQTVGTTMSAVDRADIDPGTTLKFEPGKMHVMVFGLDSKIKAGDSVEATLTFADGTKLTGPLKVEAAGSGGMAGMDHGDMH